MSKRLYWFLVLLSLVACGEKGAVMPTLMPTAVFLFPPTPFVAPTPLLMPLIPTPTPMPPATPTAVPWRVSAVSGVPQEWVGLAKTAVSANSQFVWADGEADVRLAVNNGRLVGQWVYAVAAPFATVTDETTLAEVQAGWWGQSPLGKLVVDAETAELLTAWWGTGAAQVVDSQELTEMLWAERPSYTLIPFHHLTPNLKLLRLEGQSPLEDNFIAANYPLTLSIGLVGTETAVSALHPLLTVHWSLPTDHWILSTGLLTNYNPAKLTHIAMTGVTALTRATAYQMELNGVSYPGTAVSPILTAADIAHVSNEVAFSPDCPYPDPVGGTIFCSRESYFALLQEIGVDVVELTGNHVNDWGRDDLAYTLELYRTAGMAYFGGGRDLTDAAQPALFEHNGNQIAFVGCNPVGPANAWATDSGAGSHPCDGSMETQIRQLADEGYLVMATLQYYEEYRYSPTGQQTVDFQALVDAGATAVSGSQGHHAQGFALYNGGFIHYGLGNLFFDQMDILGTRQTFIDIYVIYNGRLLSVELWTGLIENWARPRLMTQQERAQLLTTVFQASGW